MMGLAGFTPQWAVVCRMQSDCSLTVTETVTE